jgi:CRISPR-associated protein Cmr4
MNNRILGLLAETFLHPGSGKGEGAIDLMVAREAATGYPFVPGSGVKGALRDYCRADGWTDHEHTKATDEDHGRAARIFGAPNAAGRLVVSDARLLLLPVRSLTSAYKWVTCPHIVERFRRDFERAGVHVELRVDVPKAAPGELPVALTTEAQGRVFLEERLFEVKGEPPSELVELLGRAITDDGARSRLQRQLCVIDDDEMAGLARAGLAVQARNVLDPVRKTSENLWYEEALPPDTVLYTLIAERHRDEEPLAKLERLITARPYLQLGGNETVGQGWVRMHLIDGSGR